MEAVELLKAFFCTAEGHPQIGPSHIGVYATLYYLYLLNACQDPIMIRRRQVMELAKIRGIATFHKCMKDLCEARYIRYEGMKNPARRSRVWLNPVNTGY
jgi:hypothetical protein